MIFVIVALIGLNAALGYAAFNLLRKLEFYEQTINDFYSKLNMTLHNMRSLDEKQMFESDDEVGSVFSQLVDLINDLRPLLYENVDEKN